MALEIRTLPASQKQIVLNITGTYGTLLYVVPIGRVCIGTLIPNAGSASAVIINDVSISLGTTALSVTPPQITLLAGTVVKSAGSVGSFVGVEQ